jgi:hypothetical protein
MKITMTVDCTPDEARAFLGFPNVAAIQEQMMAAMQEQFRQQMSTDPETAMKAWFGPGLQTMNEMQKAWSSFMKPSSAKE